MRETNKLVKVEWFHALLLQFGQLSVIWAAWLERNGKKQNNV